MGFSDNSQFYVYYTQIVFIWKIHTSAKIVCVRLTPLYFLVEGHLALTPPDQESLAGGRLDTLPLTSDIRIE